MNYTPHYELNKPELAEQFNLADWNENSDKIDTQMFKNETNIGAIMTALTTRDVSDTDSLYYKMMKLIYPIGSLYWSSSSINPAELFGGTWTQIKDKFVWAKGDNDTVNTTGGEKTHTLIAAEMPSHSHTFTPTGTITGSKNYKFSIRRFSEDASSERVIDTVSGGNVSVTTIGSSGSGNRVQRIMNTDANYSEVSWSSPSHSFSGSQGTTETAGSGTAHNNMPPYIVKYCWERTE